MTILQCGVPKSGNFWLYKIIQEILKSEGSSTTSFIERQPIYELARNWELNFPDQARIDVLEVTDLQYSYRISSIFQMPVEDISKYVNASPHIWTHSPVCRKTSELLDLVDKKVCIIRDPRDRALSAARYYCSDYMLRYFPQEEKDPEQFLVKNFEKLMHQWVWHVYDYVRLSRRHNIHLAFFEGFLYDFQYELDRLLNYLEISPGEEQRQRIEEAVSFNRMKSKNPKHLKKGKAGYWMEQLSDDHVQKADAIAGPLICFLGYPKDRNEPMTHSANLPLHQIDYLKQEILQSQQQHYANTA